jgi:orotidine-5'-phosphate decarboxylase
LADLILALDLPTRDEALWLLDRLPRLRWVKVGSILMTAHGPELVRELIGRGLQVFLDLKWHDIPNTVAGAVKAGRQLGVSMATVHVAGGRDMMEAAAQAAGESLAVVGVTVLTSQRALSADETDDADSHTLDKRSVSSVSSVDQAVTTLSHAAIDAGLAGVVCSSLEAAHVRRAIGPKPLIVTPGIRRLGDSPGDQARTAGPAEAVRAGATHLVVGRPILGAKDPVGALDEFMQSLTPDP